MAKATIQFWWKKSMRRCAMIKGVFCLVVAGMLTGCAGLGFDDYEKYAETLASHSQAESVRIASQSNAIRDTVSRAGATDNERLLLAVIGSMQIERLSPVKLDITPPVTGMQVLNTLSGQATAIMGFGALGYLGAKAVEGAGQVTFNGDSNSYAPFESHITGSSQASMSIPYQSPTTTTTGGME